jgi:hypothetical protein
VATPRHHGIGPEIHVAGFSLAASLPVLIAYLTDCGIGGLSSDS